jgi:diguanylate cyclase (GGDEF)-like protein
MDNIRELNDTQGLNVGDRVLDAVAQLIGGSARGEQCAARLSAQKFLLMFPDLPAREATNVVERIRQYVEATQFRRDAGAIKVTVSCAVAEAAAADTKEVLFDRVETTLREAKRYGRNRTFLHDGKFPAPVVPPVLPVETRTLAI